MTRSSSGEHRRLGVTYQDSFIDDSCSSMATWAQRRKAGLGRRIGFGLGGRQYQSLRLWLSFGCTFEWKIVIVLAPHEFEWSPLRRNDAFFLRCVILKSPKPAFIADGFKRTGLMIIMP